MSTERFPVEKSDDEWRRTLTPEQCAVLRGHGTERPGSCALLAEKRAGAFRVRRVRAAAVRGRPQVRERHGLAQLFAPLEGSIASTVDRTLRHGADRGALQPVRRPPGSRVRGRTAADGLAVLHQRRGADVRAGREHSVEPAPTVRGVDPRRSA